MKEPTKLKLIIIRTETTQREVAAKSGLDASVISLIARGRLCPTQLQEQRIAAALNCNIKDIFGE